MNDSEPPDSSPDQSDSHDAEPTDSDSESPEIKAEASTSESQVSSDSAKEKSQSTESEQVPSPDPPAPTLLSHLLSDLRALVTDKKNRKKHLAIGGLALAGLAILILWWKIIVTVFLWLVIVPCTLIGLISGYSAIREKDRKERKMLLGFSGGGMAAALVAWFLIPNDPAENGAVVVADANLSRTNIEDSKSELDSLTSSPSWQPPPRKPKSPAEIAQEIKDATVLISCGAQNPELSGSGSGFFVRPNVIATNFHVIDPVFNGWDIKDLKVILRSGSKREKTYPARVMTYDLVNDLALLHVEADNQPRPIALGDSDKLFETQKVKLYGFPLGSRLSVTGGNPAITITSGSISSLRKGLDGDIAEVQIDATALHGNSGGPCCIENGLLAGVLARGPRDTTNVIVPVNRLKALLRTIPNLKAWGQKGAFWFHDCAEIAEKNLGSREWAIEILKKGMPRYPDNHKFISEYAGLRELTNSNVGRALLTLKLQGQKKSDVVWDDLYLINPCVFPLTNVRTTVGNKYVHIRYLGSGKSYFVEDGHDEIVKRGRLPYFDSDQGRGGFNYPY
jgi:S1-C subfamily serine protease